MAEKTRRPLWRRKRWWAVSAIVVVAAHLASLGPLTYCEARGWVVAGTAARLDPYSAYIDWWHSAGRRHSPVRRPVVRQINTSLQYPVRLQHLPRIMPMPDRDTPVAPAEPADVPPSPSP